MPTDCVSFQNSGFFSSLINDYLNKKPTIKPFYNRFPEIESFGEQISEKHTAFSNEKRLTLTTVLRSQYKNIAISETTKNNIELLSQPTTFTVTTGHQLNLFSGPLYFLYKIISTINLAKQLKATYPSYNFVPIYWMATEDHDFEEINHFNFKGKTLSWNCNSKGSVGKLPTDGLAELYNVFALELGGGNNAIELKKLFRDAYMSQLNLTDATRQLANALFADYGLVILDADNHYLKNHFAPYIKEELLHQTSFKNVNKSIEALEGYKIQVNPREINLFYVDENLRERIVFENNRYHINNTKISFSQEEILNKLAENPEQFSPNVILRPLYQEVILPNLCYIGGGGEIAYWLELKSMFDSAGVPFPILALRNSALLVSEKQIRKADKLSLTWKDLFLPQEELMNQQTHKLSSFAIDLSPQKKLLEEQFAHLYSLAKQTDKSFVGAVKAQEVKQKKGLEVLEKRLLKAQRRKQAEILDRIAELQNELFPLQKLQERYTNFSEFYMEAGTSLISTLIEKLKPLESSITIMNYDI